MGVEHSIVHKKGAGEVKFVPLAKGKKPVLNPSPSPTPARNVSIRGKKSRRSQHKKAAMATPVQRLFDTCKEVFKFGGTGIVPSPDNVEKLRTALDDIKPADLGLNPEMACLSLERFSGTASSGVKPAIRYLHVHECNKFSIGIFCLPPTAVLPLHNHPGMTVFSKLLFGTMHIKSYDWVADIPAAAPVGLDTADEEKQNSDENGYPIPRVERPKVRLAKVKNNSNLTAPCETSILYPAEGGNMHCFTAVTACAVLDVLGPPYNDDEGRHCQYYYDFPSSAFHGVAVPEEEKEGYGWLQERERPEDLVVRGELYRGPPFAK
ncbi:Plant cysteine oxidase 2 [Linum grandiflorum]